MLALWSCGRRARAEFFSLTRACARETKKIKTSGPERFKRGLSIDQRQSGEVLSIQEEQVEQEVNERGVALVESVLDEVEGCPAGREDPAEITIQVGALRGQREEGLGVVGYLPVQSLPRRVMI